ncbi:hypothetical protein B0H17DRAFT_1002865 [Mycena rosella]|uniref:NmrA-like domain-containing protein n=1 Tax=Mycena rosella TaxID=1033263 RepID=A0AAD7GTV4_MYCRO|nr:hypothetical protein B0H17DRAFT_1002865 [Mycena rosella]
MSTSRIVSVFGATGLQGAAVVHALLEDGTFSPRAIVRNPECDAALKLKAAGADVVTGDWLDKASLVSALSGSEAVFALTFPVFGPGQTQVDQGKHLIDAAKEVGVKFFVFTSLPSIAEVSGGKYKSCVHYDQKAEVDAYLRTSGLANASLFLGAFLENYWKFDLLKKTATGFDVAVPNYSATDRQAFTWVEHDVPAATLALLKNYTDPSKKVSGKSYPIVNATISYTELAAMTAKALGVEVTFTSAPPMGIPPVDEMYAALAEYSGLYTATPVPNPDLTALGMKFGTIEEFLETVVKPRFGQ